MNISYNWLKEFLDFDLTPEETAKALTSIGLENGPYKEVETVKGGLEGLVIGEVLTCTKHPDSDHLHLTTVDVGQEEPLKIVCGAPNVAAGQKVVVAVVGTKLYDGEESFTIKKSKIRGQESHGMICAEDEIGVGTSHDGIIVLPSDTPVGMYAKEYYGITSEYVLEVDITPNRVDASSHFGVARDLAAYLKQSDPSKKLKRPSVESFKSDNNDFKVEVIVENTEACPRYAGVTVSGITVAESPKWLQDRLRLIGVRPINNVVDITNYLLHETGQPLHAFDGDKIKGQTIHVRTSPEGTVFKTLDEVERKLSANDLMICDAEKPMCIGGVFGGADSGVSETTKRIFIESAYFNPVWIRKTARRHGMNTDASFRFERGVDPNNILYVLKRAALMVKELCGGTISSEIVDQYPNPIHDFLVSLSLKKANSLIGKALEPEKVKSILKALDIEILSENGDLLELKVPSYRVDVQRDVDVVEDILRIYGYNNVEISDSLKSNISYSNKPDSHKLQNLVAEQLTASGFNEILNNSLTSADYYTDLKSFPKEETVMMLNPLSSDLNGMRQTLLFGGLESIAYNRNRRKQDLKFYEYGNCYHFKAENRNQENRLSPYSEEYHLGLWITGNKTAQTWIHAEEKTSFFELKAYVENILSRLGIERNAIVIEEGSDDLFAKNLVFLTRGGKLLAKLGSIQAGLLKKFDIDTEVFYADILWKTLLDQTKKAKISSIELSKYPEVRRDLALLIDKTVRFAEIEKIALATEKKLLKNVALFDVYEGKNLPQGKKSYAVSFTLQDETQTLNDKLIEGIMNKLIKNFETQLGASLR
ncbi:MAG TPA: phenylalanine--tRNA ligase subunit beta [Bacteroidales bacterium]|nr:phenylalanine--tRNA ligase subunit beta [Bacteroidales bacterium]